MAVSLCEVNNEVDVKAQMPSAFKILDLAPIEKW